MDNELLQQLKDKYGLNKLRLVANLYNVGIPEKYWFTTPTPAEQQVIAEIKNMNAAASSIAVVTDDIQQSNQIIAYLIRDLHRQKVKCKYLDFVFIVNSMVDKFGQMNMDLINELNNYELIAITNIRSYGKMYDRIMGVFSSFVDSLFNGVMNKQVILSMEIKSNELADIGKIYGDELYRTIDSSFEIYQYIVNQNEIK